MSFVSIIDYGSGNITSVYNAILKILSKETICKKIIVTSNPTEIAKSSHIILPGVGSFKGCLNGFYSKPGLFEALSENVLVKNKPFLGICVGMQMLAEKGFEDGESNGFGWIKGEVRPINVENNNYKIPHIGWNNLELKRNHSFIDFLKRRKKLPNTEVNAYFVHSYSFMVKEPNVELISTRYSDEITAMVGKRNILGTQFHPEKSQRFGLDFLEAFISWEL
jgi:imidazole glycerol-phosphate synthase subunit HisH|tara:strand:+ start:190 stop:855 length:666 start_codon:yes stop_codon:yes gene_type:complete